MYPKVRTLAWVATALALSAAADALTLDTVPVNGLGNPADDTGFGSTPLNFTISRFEVSQDDYIEFLNAVAADDPGDLYSANMAHALGIVRSGVAGSYSYSLQQPGASGQLPVQFVSFYDALRFANWLHNGQPTGAQGPATTEDGAYSISAYGIANNSIARSPAAKFFLPSEDEWYKAAYYDPGTGSYFDYPVGSDSETLCGTTDAPNAGNCDDVSSAPSTGGFYTNAPSPHGTFDQGGNVFEWTEGVIGGSTRVMRGGSWFSDPADQASSFRASSAPEQETLNLGFRVAPEPGAAAAGLACLALLAGLARRGGRRAASLFLLAPVLATGLAEGARALTCSDHFVAAALDEGQPKDQTLYAELCHPSATGPSGADETLLVYVHGITYDHDYWDVADPTSGSDRYSFLKAAWARGYSTLGIDRLGAGQSSHPLSALVDIESNAHTTHEVIQAVRSGAIPDAGGGTFDRVVWIGHSYGSWTGWFETSRYNDVDAAVFTAATHGLTQVDAPFLVAGNSYPAVADPLYADSGLDPGYLTTQPGTRYAALFAPGPVDPAVIAADEASKGTVTNAEIQNYQLILDEELDIQVPVFLSIGNQDTLFCGPEPGGADCSSEAALVAFETPFLGPNVPSVDAYILPGGGHDMNQMWNAALYFDAVLDWVEGTVLP